MLLDERPAGSRPGKAGRVATAGAAALMAALALASCGGSSGGGSGGEVIATTTSAASTAAPSTSAATTTTTAAPGAEQWIGVDWDAGAGGGPPVVDGAPIELTSVSGLCADTACDRSLDLLTDAPTGAAPAPGPYVLWASELRGRTADGLPQWTITDALDVTLEEGATPYLCSPAEDPTAQALGVGPVAPAEGDAIVPDEVWIVDDAGKLVSPDPAGYSCEVGQD